MWVKEHINGNNNNNQTVERENLSNKQSKEADINVFGDTPQLQEEPLSEK